MDRVGVDSLIGIGSILGKCTNQDSVGIVVGKTDLTLVDLNPRVAAYVSVLTATIYRTVDSGTGCI